MVNPAHVRQIRRFALTLSDGTRLPVPEKKFTQIRDALLQGDPPALNAAVSTDLSPAKNDRKKPSRPGKNPASL